MDRVFACFATTAEDVAAMVCGSFSHMVPQASERWQRPAVKALVRTIHQELCGPELLGRLAPVCKEVGAAAVDERQVRPGRVVPRLGARQCDPMRRDQPSGRGASKRVRNLEAL